MEFIKLLVHFLQLTLYMFKSNNLSELMKFFKLYKLSLGISNRTWVADEGRARKPEA